MAMSEVMEVAEEDSGREVELRLHQALRIALPEVRTAGFRWNLCALKEHVLSLAEDDIHAAVGAGGTAVHHWVFRAEEAGVATIVMEYRRSWEHGAAPTRTFSLSVRVT